VYAFGLMCVVAGSSLTEIGDRLASGGARLWWTVATTLGTAAVALWLGWLLRTEISRLSPGG
jgi:hypothetical protein